MADKNGKSNGLSTQPPQKKEGGMAARLKGILNGGGKTPPPDETSTADMLPAPPPGFIQESPKTPPPLPPNKGKKVVTGVTPAKPGDNTAVSTKTPSSGTGRKKGEVSPEAVTKLREELAKTPPVATMENNGVFDAFAPPVVEPAVRSAATEEVPWTDMSANGGFDDPSKVTTVQVVTDDQVIKEATTPAKPDVQPPPAQQVMINIPEIIRENKEFKLENAKLQLEINALKAQIALLEGQLQDQTHVEVVINDLQDRLEDKKLEMEKTAEDLKEARRAETATRRRLHEAEKLIRKAEVAYQELTRARRDIATLEEAREELAKLKAEYDSALRELAVVNNEIIRLNGEVEHLQSEINASQAQVSALSIQVQDLSTEKYGIENELSSLKIELSQKIRGYENLRDEYSALEKKHGEYKAKAQSVVNQCKIEIDRLNGEVADLASKGEDARAELKNIRDGLHSNLSEMFGWIAGPPLIEAGQLPDDPVLATKEAVRRLVVKHQELISAHDGRAAKLREAEARLESAISALRAAKAEAERLSEENKILSQAAVDEATAVDVKLHDGLQKVKQLYDQAEAKLASERELKAKAEAKVAELEKQVAEVKAEVDRARKASDPENLRKVIRKQEAILKMTNREVAVLGLITDALASAPETQVQDLEKAVEAFTNEWHQAEGEVKRLQQELETTRQTMAGQVDEALIKSQDKVRELEAKLAETESLHKKAVEYSGQHYDRALQLEAELKQATDTKATAEAKVAKLETEKTQAQAEVEKVKSELEQATEAKATAEAKVAEVNQADEALIGAKAKIEELEAKVIELESQLAKSQDEVARLNKELETEKTQATAEVNRLNAELEKAIQAKATAEARTGEIEEAASGLVEENEQVVEAKVTAEAEVSKLNQELEGVRAVCAQRFDELAQVNSELTRVREEMTEHETANEQLAASLRAALEENMAHTAESVRAGLVNNNAPAQPAQPVVLQPIFQMPPQQTMTATPPPPAVQQTVVREKEPSNRGGWMWPIAAIILLVIAVAGTWFMASRGLGYYQDGEKGGVTLIKEGMSMKECCDKVTGANCVVCPTPATQPSASKPPVGNKPPRNAGGATRDNCPGGCEREKAVVVCMSHGHSRSDCESVIP